jgi:hypothetical protein
MLALAKKKRYDNWSQMKFAGFLCVAFIILRCSVALADSSILNANHAYIANEFAG